MTLSSTDRRHWHPVPQVVKWLASQIPPGAKVLEIGPHRFQFPRATTFVDCVERPKEIPSDKLVLCDVGTEPLPFPDKHFDFVYARHVVEDLFNPFLVCREMQRVAKAGYVETPSPIAELCAGVDGRGVKWLGYHHHRYIVWSHAGELRFVPKYPVIEHLDIHGNALAGLLRQGPKCWNTYHLWNDELKWVHRQNGIDFDMMRDYEMMLEDAIERSIESTNRFWENVPERDEVAVMLSGNSAA